MEKYVIIAEFKAEEPLVMEQYLAKGDYETIHDRMKALEADPRVVRVAMAKLVFETGNRMLLAQEATDAK